MSNIDYIEYSTMFPIIFRYIIMAVLYAIIFINFQKPTIQFILFIVVFILNFFTIVFVFKDIFSTQLLIKSMYGQFIPNETQNPYICFFIAIILLTGLLFICSFAIILAVFSYGKQSTNDYKSYKMTPTNSLILTQFKTAYNVYIKYLALFVFFIIFAHTTGPTRTLMFNIGCILFSLIIISTSVYCCMASVQFLKIKQYNKQLYE